MEPTGNATNSINDAIHEFLANGVMTASICHVLALTLPAKTTFGSQLLAASSFPLIKSSGWKSWR
jgi:putative intracellular protease/amidase